jgi:hypothetical protein
MHAARRAVLGALQRISTWESEMAERRRCDDLPRR